MKSRLILLISLFALLSLAVTPGLAQIGTGGITGHVTDPSGALVVGASVSAVNVATGVRTSGTTNSAGIYELLSLIPGTYRVEASAPSFKKLVRSNVLVQVEDRIGLDFRLEVGSINETMTVTTEAPQLRTEDAQTGEVVTEHMIETLPQLNRDPLQLLTLSGDVQGGGTRAGWSLGINGNLTSGYPDTRINGGRVGDTEYLVDGVPATGGFAHNVVNDTPTMDDVEEFKVITNGISAEYGRLSGGAVSVVTKSGNNQFHGQLFEYHQDSFLNANTWNNDAQCVYNPSGNALLCKKPVYRQNDFGFAFGGPVIIPHLYNGKNKTFFFANYEGVRNSTAGNPQVGQTITDQERTGDLTDIGIGAYDPSNPNDPANNDPWAQVYDPFGAVSATPQPDPDAGGQLLYQRQDLAGGDGRHIPSTELDPVIQRYIAFMPHPNNPPMLNSGTAGNYVAAQPNVIHSNVWSVRLDHVVSEKQRIFGRFTHNNATNLTQPFYSTFGTTSGNNLPGGFGAELHWDYTFSPTLILDLHVGGDYSPFSHGTFQNSHIDGATFPYDSITKSFLGPHDIVRMSQGPFTEGTSFGGVAGGGQYNYGMDANTGASANTTIFQYAGSLTKILNRHSLKFGYEGRRYYDNVTTQFESNVSGGISDGYGWDSEAVSQFIGDNGAEVWSPRGYSNGLGEFLMGVDSWIRLTAATGRSLASNYYASYVQDDFKVSQKLTLNLGLRWEMETPVTERHNNLSIWDPNAPPPFSVNTGYDWNAALTAASLNPANVQTPGWVTNGFSNGALVFAGTAQHPSRLATQYHPWNFSPRLGFSYQVAPQTVLRGSFAMLYLPTSGNLSRYGDVPGVAYSNQVSNQATQGTFNTGAGGPPNWAPRTIAGGPFDPTQITNFTRDNHVLNVQGAISGNGVGGIVPTMHMPHEYNWNFGVQRQLPHKWLLEADYTGNASNTLITIGNPSRFPKSLYVGGGGSANQAIYNTIIPSPTAGQIPDNGVTGLNQRIALLEYAYPYYGPVIVEGVNGGASNFNAANLRVQHRFDSGFQMLFNYTYSKSLDDTGGSDTFLGLPGQGGGSSGKSFQQVDPSVSSVYGLSTLDQTHRISTFYDYQLPFGKGRRFMNSPSDAGGKILQAVAGGWEISGETIYRSGTPISMNLQGQNTDQNYGIRETFGTFTPGHGLNSFLNPNWNRDPSKAIYPSNTAPYPSSVSAFGKTCTPATLTSACVMYDPQSFTYGNIPATIGVLRNPGNWSTDISIMKSFPFSKDESHYFQLRLEGQNIFNHPGRGGYDTNDSDSTFGYVTTNGIIERHVQISGRIVF